MANKFPRKFLQALQEQGAEILLDWLKKNNAPKDVKELAESLGVLVVYLSRADYETSEYSDVAMQGLTESVVDVTACIDALGGDFRK